MRLTLRWLCFGSVITLMLFLLILNLLPLFDPDFPAFYKSTRSERPTITFREFDITRPPKQHLPFYPEDDPDRIYGDRIAAQLSFSTDKPVPLVSLVYVQTEEAEQSMWYLEGCPVKCYLSNMDQHIAGASALLFNPDFIDRLPLIRRHNQIWVLKLMESPYNTPNLVDFNGKINYTSSYRWDADFVSPYGRFIPVPPLAKPVIPRNKTKDVAWIVSHCFTVNNRMNYVRQLQKHINVSIYGECGDGHKTEEEAKEIFKQHRFYLAFENSNCHDYITEKFFDNALKNGMIPIVMGPRKRDYERVAPPHSFIHIEDFDTAEELAKFLKYLSADEDAFLKYFEWREKGTIVDSALQCRLCIGLQDPRQKLYPDIEKWWHEAGDCESPRVPL